MTSNETLHYQSSNQVTKQIYRADHVGSLLRPTKLLDARAAHAEGRLTSDQLRDIENTAILQALELQRETGIEVFTDGEYRRSTFRSVFADAVEGTVLVESGREWRNAQSDPQQSRSERVVGNKLRQIRRLAAHESSFLVKNALRPCKITVPSAGYLGSRNYRQGITDRVYPSIGALLRDISQIIRNEIVALIGEGVTYVQLDAPGYAAFVDQDQRQLMVASGIDPDRQFEECLAADNLSIEGLQSERIILAMHVCRGNSRSKWHSQGGYEPIADKLFNQLDIHTFLLEYDSERAGSFEPLRFVPKGKHIVLGLVTTKEGKLEAQEDLLRRIDEASKYVVLENLSLSPQCGFASGASGNLLSWDDQRRKLELVAETARKAWGN
jgi:5-methyltetrahydropteroyltriglutamate--homocysteine methyltransferase